MKRSVKAILTKAHPPLGPVASQRGGILIEFAFLSLVFYVLVALVVDIGRMVFAAQVLQDAARVAARELSLVPLPAAMTF
ncbi:MAG: pilus assembly protein, partial [Nitrospira sp.]|nr:pilus assembly protein [Nitrospira sp.]